MKKTLIALVAVLAFPATALAGKAETKLTFDGVFLASGQTHWSGDVFSSKKVCKDKRRVTIFRVRSGADEKVGSTKSFKGMADNGYYWTYFENGAAPKGKYYAKAKPTDRCQGDTSNKLKLQY